MSPHPIDVLLPGFAGLDPAAKVAAVERLTVAARAHPSGIMVCMPYVAADGLRQVREADLAGMERQSDNFGHRLKSPTDFFDNENSITTAGSHLVAQSIRYQTTGEPAALAAALAAHRSLRTVFEFGVQAGQRGFMGKPFHFEHSAHTTGDQYLHALWGWWTFLPVAPAEVQAEIRAMIIAMADYQMAVDYTIFNRSGGNWNNRLDPTDYNAIMAALVAAAHRLAGGTKYREACKFVLQTGRWMHERRLDTIIAEFRAGTYRAQPWDRIAGADVAAGEFAHWEQIQHCQFAAISAAIIHECIPDLLPLADLRRVLALWWSDHPLGFDPEARAYLYWFLVSVKDMKWRRVSLTPRLPREQWFGGHPMLSFAAEWIYGDCLARFMWTAMLVARHCPERRAEAADFAADTLRALAPRHLLWMADPDGRQIPPELGYYTRFLSSEVPECLIATYWEGRRLGLWS
jgi:hypothetical protein